MLCLPTPLTGVRSTSINATSHTLQQHDTQLHSLTADMGKVQNGLREVHERLAVVDTTASLNRQLAEELQKAMNVIQAQNRCDFGIPCSGTLLHAVMIGSSALRTRCPAKSLRHTSAPGYTEFSTALLIHKTHTPPFLHLTFNVINHKQACSGH